MLLAAVSSLQWLDFFELSPGASCPRLCAIASIPPTETDTVSRIREPNRGASGTRLSFYSTRSIVTVRSIVATRSHLLPIFEPGYCLACVFSD